MHPHRVASRVIACCGVVLLVGCAKADQPADTTAAIAPGGPNTTAAASGGAMSTPIAFSDVAGTWKVRAVPQGGTDTTATEYTLTAAGTAEGWKIVYANGQTVPVRVSVSGDSIISDAGPYKSVRRKGVEVTTHSVLRKEGDKLVGTTVAHYKTAGADSVLTLRSEGTRVP
jgi:hypothetical protein